MIRTAERCSRIQLEFRRIRREVLLYHQCDLENDCVVEFTQIQTGQLLDLLQAVHQCITVYEQLTEVSDTFRLFSKNFWMVKRVS